MNIIHGDCFAVLPTLEENSIDLVVTSPPYAEQRKDQYSSISEKDYPAWTKNWMKLCRPLLKNSGSIAIVIRPHVRNGQISDYVLNTRIELRKDKWIEADEFIWIKPNSPPLGHVGRPRRSWESILWFSKTNKPFCDPKFNGNPSDRIGLESKKGVGNYIAGTSKSKSGIARSRDYVSIGTSENNRSPYNTHPAVFPVELAKWIITTLSPERATILDPFVGSGSTVIACLETKRSYIGIEQSHEYHQIALKRAKDHES